MRAAAANIACITAKPFYPAVFVGIAHIYIGYTHTYIWTSFMKIVYNVRYA